MEPLVWTGDLFQEDDVGVWRCSGCHRSTAEVDDNGHAGTCAHLPRLEGLEPKTELRRRAVGEWTGLREAILRDHDLRANLVSEIVKAYRLEYRRAKKRELPLETRGKTGKAAKALETQLRKAGKVFDELEVRERAFELWWSSSDRIDGRGGPPRGRKK